MCKVTQRQLETTCLLWKARKIVNKFENNNIYTNKDVYSKQGVIKILSEEYCPLVTYANSKLCVRSLRLLSESNPGPDAEIKYWWRSKETIQITCSNEGYDRALQRELLRHGETVFSGQTHKRTNGEVEATGRILESSYAKSQQIVSRILDAIKKKEKKFYEGTDTLIIQEDPIKFTYLNGLHERVKAVISEAIVKSYRNIYIIYGQEVQRVTSST